MRVPKSITDPCKKLPVHRCRITIQGAKVEIEYMRPPKKQVGGGKRNIVSGYSPSSRLRFLRTLATIDWTAMPAGFFVTLTFPDECLPDSPRHLTDLRHRWIRSIEKHLQGNVPMLWRCEWKIRKSGDNTGSPAPHFHLVVFTANMLTKHTCMVTWKEIIKADREIQVECDPMDTASMAALYAAKYMSKVDEDSLILDNGTKLSTGRPWGIHRPSLIPRCKKIVLLTECEKSISLIAQITAGVRGDPEANESLKAVLLGKWSEEFLKLMADALDDPLDPG
jgi:hypothetical protein